MKLNEIETKLVLFTGKGGVGKTSLACATAISWAEKGKKVLLVSTDPASNLGQVFSQEIGESSPTPISLVNGLFALNINPESAAQVYRNRMIDPVRGILPDQTVREMEEQLSGACTTEIAAFDEFTGLLTEQDVSKKFDHMIFDTAPTGHTMRLLQLPTAWTNFLDSSTTGASCLGPLAGLDKQRKKYEHSVSLLADKNTTTIVLVSRPQPSSLVEANRTSTELSHLGIENQILVINGIMPGDGGTDPLARAIIARETKAVEAIPSPLGSLPRISVPLRATNMVGIPALKALLDSENHSTPNSPRAGTNSPLEIPNLASLVDGLEKDGHGLVMVMGKGGVGKTTVASAIAVALANRGHQVHLTTTDPAAHLSMTIEADFPNLAVDRIDPVAEKERYQNEVIRTKGQNLDDPGKALLKEDLRSPCTEEIAIFQAFSRVIQESRQKFVVIDTAPTGHTLLLIDATGAYHRDVVRHVKPGIRAITPMMRLRDPAQTKMVIVSLAETTPVLEAEALQNDLRRAEIEPWAWVINGSLAAASPSDPILKARAQEEIPLISRVRESNRRLAIIPYLAKEPMGSNRLLELAGEKAPASNQADNIPGEPVKA